MKRAKRIALTLTALVVMTWSVLRLAPRLQTITEKQQPVMAEGGCCIADFAWLNDHEVLYSESNSPTLVRWNTRTRLKSSFAVPKSLSIFVGATSMGSSHPWLVSPNGRWLLWRADCMGSAFVEDVNSGQCRRVASLPPNPFDRLLTNWRTDSKGVVQIDTVRTTGVATLATYLLPPNTDPNSRDRRLADHLPPGAIEILGTDSQGRTLAMLCDDRTDRKRFSLLDISPNATAQTPTPLLSFPKQEGIVCWALSSQGDRIVWTRRQERLSKMPRWLSHLMFRQEPQDEYDTTLYLSKVDGSNWREIGRDEGEPVSDFINPPQWVPGGKAISYIRNGSLYTLPVP